MGTPFTIGCASCDGTATVIMVDQGYTSGPFTWRVPLCLRCAMPSLRRTRRADRPHFDDITLYDIERAQGLPNPNVSLSPAELAWQQAERSFYLRDRPEGSAR